MSAETPKTIWIITEERPTISTETGSRDGLRDTGAFLDEYDEPIEFSIKGRVAVPVEKLKKEITDFLQVVGDLFQQAEQQQPEMQLDEIELSVEINTEGQVSLFGIGGKNGDKGAITLKFKRKDSK
ncbi:MAG TPA: hypothetical protein V6C90_08905 [Coleofasciculaceae cyanobacterium]|jgi:hypothetical protein